MTKRRNRREGIVYSTDSNFGYDDYEDGEETHTPPPSKQSLRIALDRLKGNKRVTRIWNFVGSDQELTDLGKSLKKSCGCGGSVKDGNILLQGDFRDKAGKLLSDMDYRYKNVGG